MIGTNRYIGSPVERIEDLRLLRGRGQFVGDLKRESMLHAAILRSPAAHGLVAAVDASAALAIAGIRAVITAKDIGPVPRIPLRLLPLPGTERFLQPVIAVERVRYVGEPVAVVLGDSPALAEDGVGAIALDIEELPPVSDRQASGRGEILLFEGAGTNAAMVFTGVKGDADAAFRDAEYVRRDRFAVQRYTALPMEPRVVLALNTATQDGKRVTIGFGQDPGQAGKSQAQHLVRALSGFTVRPATESGDKLTRFRPFSSQCRAGNVRIRRGSWNEELFRVLEGFPDLAHDDEVDACSGALEMLNPQMKGWGIYELYRQQAEQLLQAERQATSGHPEPAYAPGSMEWLAEQHK